MTPKTETYSSENKLIDITVTKNNQNLYNKRAMNIYKDSVRASVDSNNTEQTKQPSVTSSIH